MALTAVLGYLHEPLQKALQKLPGDLQDHLEEIRLRQGQPLMVNYSGGESFVNSNGGLVKAPEQAYQVSSEDLVKTLHILTNSSLYALEEELRRGFITVPGGHRVGMAGRAVVENGKIRTLKHINALNFRIARHFPGAGDRVLPYLYNRWETSIHHTLIISPPCCGKTTLLRDLVRQISLGQPKLGMPGLGVGLVDERSEVAGCYRGIPQLDVGPRTDVLDGCPKAEGMMMLIRSMNPRVIAIDEIGTAADIGALEEALNAGIKILATVHGASFEELSRRPNLKYILQNRFFSRLVVLGRDQKPGVVKGILDGTTLKRLHASSL